MLPDDPKRRHRDRLVLVSIFLIIAGLLVLVAGRILAWRAAHGG